MKHFLSSRGIRRFSLFYLVSLLALMACSKALEEPKESAEMERMNKLTELNSTDPGFMAFQQTFYPLVREHCSLCHGGIIYPQFADPQVDNAWAIVQDFRSTMPDYLGSPLVNLENAKSSRIVHRLARDRHSCWSDCDENADEMLAAIRQWALLEKGDGQPTGCEDEKQQLSKRTIRLLSNAEYLNTLYDLFGEVAIKGVNLPNDISRRHLFDHMGEERPVQLSQLRAYYEAADQVAAVLVDEPLLGCRAESSCADSWLSQYAWQLWRRPLSSQELAELRGLYEAALASYGHADLALKDLITATLVSPHFLYRSELGQLQADDSYRLSSWEVASALSYFFWRSLPDEPLFALARANRLQDAEQIKAELSRLIEDERAYRGLGDFARLWTRSYRVVEAEKEAPLADKLTPAIRRKLAQETIDTFLHIIFDDPKGDFRTLMTAPYSMGHESLAEYYGVPLDAEGRLDFAGEPRRGIMTQGSLMASYSFSDESSPIHRGVFILENILCRHFPEPPAVMIPDKSDEKSNRDRFKDHSKLAECAVCHQQIDGVGFGFEHFDSLGLYRSHDAGKKVDASGTIDLDGFHRSYQGTAEFAELLAESRDAKQCFTRQVLRFQTGRLDASPADACRMNRLYERFAADDFRLKTLLTELFADPAFLNRHAAREER